MTDTVYEDRPVRSALAQALDAAALGVPVYDGDDDSPAAAATPPWVSVWEQPAAAGQRAQSGRGRRLAATCQMMAVAATAPQATMLADRAAGWADGLGDGQGGYWQVEAGYQAQQPQDDLDDPAGRLWSCTVQLTHVRRRRRGDST